MKTIGLIGGISWISTQDYYKYINEGVNEKIGGMNFSRLIMHSMNYADIKKIMTRAIGTLLLNYCRMLVRI
jgi:aspartate racemase